MFQELLDNPRPIEPGCLQTHARQQFPAVVRISHLRRRVADEPTPAASESRYVILGIASYAPDELRLLDELESSHPQWHGQWQVAVFDLMECTSPAEVQRFAPQSAAVVQSPAVEIWEGGRLLEANSGLRSTREALRKHGILS